MYPQIKVIERKNLKTNKHNARTHSKKQVQQIIKSIEEFGFINPIIIDRNNNIIAGHGRVLAAQEMNIQDIPAIMIENLSPEQIRAYIIADNKIAANAGWDMEILKEELEFLSTLADFELEVTGFETPELDLIIGDKATEDDILPVTDNAQNPITQLGDIWELGKHKLICGNSLDKNTYNHLLEQNKAQMIFADPPYNVPINGYVCGAGKIKHKEFAMASGEMSQEEFRTFLLTFCALLKSYSQDGSLHYICMDWKHINDLLNAGEDVYNELKNICIWNKDNGGMGSMYRSKHEMICVFKNGKSSHINNIELGKHGRYRTNVWDYPGVNSMRKDRIKDLEMHPTVKPVALVEDAIKDCTKRNQIILDPFGGSGTTLIASENTGRIAKLIEIEPAYCDTTIRRWQQLTQQQAIHTSSQKSFNQLEEEATENGK